jgi:hypothetical protein
VFLPPDGPGQLATGALITFFFLLINLICRPFCTEGLNNLQSYSLISQFLTLFCGILIGYMESMADTGSDSSEKEDTRIFGSIIVIINFATLVFPILRKLLTGKHTELVERLTFVATFPSKCYVKCCEGKASIAKKRAERAARDARSGNTTASADLTPLASPIIFSEVQSRVYFQDCAALDKELGFSSTEQVNTHTVKMQDSAVGVLVQDVEDNEHESILGATSESTAPLPTNIGVFPPGAAAMRAGAERALEALGAALQIPSTPRLRTTVDAVDAIGAAPGRESSLQQWYPFSTLKLFSAETSSNECVTSFSKRDLWLSLPQTGSIQSETESVVSSVSSSASSIEGCNGTEVHGSRQDKRICDGEYRAPVPSPRAPSGSFPSPRAVSSPRAPVPKQRTWWQQLSPRALT